MTRIKVVDRTPRIRDVGKKAAPVARETVAAALGAPVARAPVRASASTYAAVRAELVRRLGSTGGRPGLASADRRQKIPLADEDWNALVELADTMSDQSPRPTPGQIASAMIRVGLQEPARAGYPIVGRTGASRANDAAASPAARPGPPRYPATIALACSRYLDQLDRVIAAGPARAALAAGAVRDLIEAAQARPDRVRPAQVEALIAQVEALSLDDRVPLINQFALGLGRDDAEVLVIGTEQAFELTDARSLVMASYADQVSWLTAGRADPLAAAGAEPPRRPFHLHPTDWYDVSAAHTWGRLAAVLGAGNEHRRGAAPGLGDLAYQIELSAHPSKRNAKGLAPSPERLAFLETVIRTLASSARVVMFHGRAGSSALEAPRRVLARAFLGIEPEWIHVGEPNRPLRYTDAAGRRVIVTRALANAGVSWDFLGRLAELVRGATPVRLPAPRPRLDRRQLLDDAAEVVRDTLGIARLRPNGSQHDDKNREGTFARDVQIGLTATRSTFRVFLWSRAPDRHRLFEELLAAVDAATLPPPLPEVPLELTRGAQARELRYLGVEVPDDTPDLVELTAEVAAWFARVRDRF